MRVAARATRCRLDLTGYVTAAHATRVFSGVQSWKIDCDTCKTDIVMITQYDQPTQFEIAPRANTTCAATIKTANCRAARARARLRIIRAKTYRDFLHSGSTTTRSDAVKFFPAHSEDDDDPTSRGLAIASDLHHSRSSEALEGYRISRVL